MYYAKVFKTEDLKKSLKQLKQNPLDKLTKNTLQAIHNDEVEFPAIKTKEDSKAYPFVNQKSGQAVIFYNSVADQFYMPILTAKS